MKQISNSVRHKLYSDLLSFIVVWNCHPRHPPFSEWLQMTTAAACHDESRYFAAKS